MSMRAMACALLALVMSAGCSVDALEGPAAPGWRYEVGPLAPREARVRKDVVAVTVFDDRRPMNRRSSRRISLTPLVFSAAFRYHRPEHIRNGQIHKNYLGDPPRDLAEATVAELRGAGCFRDVFLTERELPPDCDYVMRGWIDTFRYEGRVYTYGFSLAAMVPWALGLPMSKTHNELVFELQLERVSDGVVVWESGPLGGKSTNTAGVYYNTYKDFDGFPELAKAALVTALEDLELNLEWNLGRLQAPDPIEVAAPDATHG